MSTDQLQPLSSLGALPKEDAAGSETGAENNPARQDYMEARKLLDKGEYVQAAMGFHNALRGFEEQGDRIGVANAADRLGDACLGRQEFAMAMANFERAYAICVEEEDSFSQLSLNKKMAYCCRKLGQHARALECLDDMLEHYQLNRNPKGAVETLETLAEVYAELGDKLKAAGAYRSAASIHAHFKHARRAEELMQMAAEMEQGQ